MTRDSYGQSTPIMKNHAHISRADTGHPHPSPPPPPPAPPPPPGGAAPPPPPRPRAPPPPPRPRPRHGRGATRRRPLPAAQTPRARRRPPATHDRTPGQQDQLKLSGIVFPQRFLPKGAAVPVPYPVSPRPPARAAQHVNVHV